MKLELTQSLEREQQVIEAVERAVAAETTNILEYSKDVFDKEVAIRPEVERYLMMLEDL